MGERYYTLVTLTTGMSFQRWADVGILDREFKYYQQLSRRTYPLIFLSYGSDVAAEAALLERYLPDARVFLAPRWSVGLPFQDLYRGLFVRLSTVPKGCRLVRSNQWLGSWVAWFLAWRLGVPFVLRSGYAYTDLYRRQGWRKVLGKAVFTILEFLTLKAADRIIITYEAGRDYFVHRYGLDASKFTIIGNPIDTELFLRREVSKSEDVITVARLTDQKNLHVLISACASQELSLTIVGSGNLKANLAEQANESGARVTFIERVPNEELPDLICRHRVFALVSHYEGNPKALLEAMSLAMPCVVSRIKEHTPIIQDGLNGVLVERNDVQEVGRALVKLVREKALSDQIGKAAREEILANYSIDAAAEKEAGLYSTLLAQK